MFYLWEASVTDGFEIFALWRLAHDKTKLVRLDKKLRKSYFIEFLLVIICSERPSLSSRQRLQNTDAS